MDETGAYYTEWSKPERKTPIQYTNTYICTDEKTQKVILNEQVNEQEQVRALQN